MKQILKVLLLSFLACANGIAGEADVVGVKVTKEGPRVFRFTVTVKHTDEGWDHYADKWDIIGPDGTTLGSRVLIHPHVDEQPFTRSLGNVDIPEGVDNVTIRANDTVHGFGGMAKTVVLPK